MVLPNRGNKSHMLHVSSERNRVATREEITAQGTREDYMRVQHLIQRCLFALSCLLVSSQLAACGSSNTGSSQDTGIPPGQASEAGPPPLILRDPSPSQLSVFVAVKIGGYDAVT